MTQKKLTPDEIVSQMKTILGNDLHSSEIRIRQEGADKQGSIQVWLTVDKSAIIKTIQATADIHYPHLSVISGCDIGEAVELNYHMYIYYGYAGGDYNITVKVLLPKSDLTLESITGIIPGAVISEREKQEFFGIKILNIPDERRLFLPEDFPEGVFPWRKDETGIKEEMVKKLYDVGKAEGKKRRDAAKSN